MIRRLFLLLTLLATGLAMPVPSVFAQEEIARLDLGRKEAVPDFVAFSRKDKGLVTVGNLTRRSSRYMGLFKYDADFNKSWSKQVLEQNGRKNIDFLTVLGDQIYCFVSEYFARDRTIKTYFYQYDIAGNVIHERKIISESPNVKEHRVDLKYVQSINRRTLLCYKNLNTSNENERITYTLFREGDQEMIQGGVELPYPDDKFEVKSLEVSNAGTIYLLGKYFKVNRVREPDDYAFMVFRHTAGSETMEEVQLSFGENYISDLTLKVSPNENIFVAGYYSNKSTREIIGTVYQKINAAGVPEVQMLQPFDEAFLAEFLSDRQISRGAELKYFYLDDIVLRSDGGVLLMGEKYYSTYNSYLDIYGYWVDQRIHHYDEIIIHSVSPTGELEWSQTINKRQASENKANLGYTPVITGESIYLMYEYHPRRSPRTVYYNVVGMDGGVGERQALILQDSRNFNFFPRSSEQISNREALLLFNRDRGKITTISRFRFY